MKKKKQKKFMDRFGVMNFILILVGVALLVFTIEMIRLYKEFGDIPDTLVTCVYTTLGGECGIMGWIKTTKEKNKERERELEDRELALPKADEEEAAG